ncbi:hypothetical protein [Mycobacterium sp. ACS4331]|uniref:hypothetical protein n=1 Tax=Mycobacterium sp. ACS4331 TaxID=1834121 RepID=UPI0007FFADEF|nr:hypothetical protein [Mycobacterium sp. ACS4331]OBF14880.1 hypothetical protein A5727_15370 [Mycobacterium sp. ACS4331]
MSDIDAAVAGHEGRSRIALQYTQTTKRLNDAAKQPGFSKNSWGPLAELVAVDEFERVGNFKEVMNWTEYIEFLTNWAPSSEWEGSFKRVSEVNGVVFLELEERSRVGDFESVVNSLTVFEFTEDDKIRHLDLYLQMALPNLDMLGSYEGVEISE